MMRMSRFNIVSLIFGIAFLYVPILVVALYSFNASKLVTVWGGFSVQWYRALWSNGPLLESAWVSVRIAFISACGAAVIGTMAALALRRYRRFKGKSLFAFMLFAPLVLPEIMTGLSLLLLFVALDWDRGFWTVALAHMAFTIAFVALVIDARLADLDPAFEEAARDLGATPFSAFWRVTFPMIAPAILAGFLLAFTLSLDDLVIASFTSGPGATTLPMRLYGQMRLGVTPEINAASTVMIVTVTLVVIIVSLLTKRRARSG